MENDGSHMSLYNDKENLPMLGTVVNNRSTKKKVSLSTKFTDIFKRNKHKNKKKNKAVTFQEDAKRNDSPIVVWEKQGTGRSDGNHRGYKRRYSKSKKRRDSFDATSLSPKSRTESLVFNKPFVRKQRSRSIPMDNSMHRNQWNLITQPIRISQTSNVIYHSDIDY